MAMMLQMMQQASQNPPLQEKPDPGTLIIVDNFTRLVPDQTSIHGNDVQTAARTTGFDGPVSRREFPKVAEFGSAAEALATLKTEPLTAKATDEKIAAYARNVQMATLQGAAQELDKHAAAGTRYTAFNLSQGTSEASIVLGLYNEGATGKQIFDNFVSAFELDREKLLSQDPQTHGPERLKMQQAIADRVHTALQHPSVRQARENYDRAVHDFEFFDNSVVVAAGNEGEVLQMLERDTGGRKLEVGPEFERNVLANHEVTTVAAKDASYNSREPEIDLFADGTLGERTGTSYASPRIAARMAQLHGEKPWLSSGQVENLVRLDAGEPLFATPT